MTPPFRRQDPGADSPRVIAEGVRDGDAIVYELVPMQTFVFEGRSSTFQSIPMPVFDTAEYGASILSLMIRSVSGFALGSRVRLWIQNAVQTPDDPAQMFVTDMTSLTVETTPTPPTLKTAAWSPVGPGARLRIEWQQGALGGTATSRFSVWLTRRWSR